MTYVVIFVFGFAIDVAYAVYVRACVDRRPFRAAVASLLIAAPALFGYLAIVKNYWLSLAYLSGLAAGTYVAVRWGNDPKNR